jgi:hypothetical protein
VAFINEDPTVDDNLLSDDGLMLLSSGLDRTFLSSRDCDTLTAEGVCQGNGQRDMTIGEIVRRFDHTSNSAVSAEQRWNVPNTLRVQTKRYNHVDAALMNIAGGDTVNLVLKTMPNGADMVSTVMFAREEQFRALNLDVQGKSGHITWSGTNIALDFGADGGLKQHTLAALSWAPFRFNGTKNAWEAAPIDEYWDHFKQLHVNDFADQVASGEIDAEVAEGKLVFAQLYYLSLYSGAVRIVQVGNAILKAASALPDKPLGATITSTGLKGVKHVVDAAFLVMFDKMIVPKANIKGMLRFLSALGKEQRSPSP